MKFLAAFLSLILLAAAAPAAVDKRGLPVPPSKDPWYTPQSGFELQKLGTILKHRTVTNPIGIVIAPIAIEHVYELMVRSEDTFGNATAITTTIFIPAGADGLKVLSYQPAEDSSNLDCAPSYAMQLGANPVTIVSTQLEEVLVQAGLKEGWIVNVPDWEGPGAAFGAGRQAGKATLNSIRAALQSENITGIKTDADVALWGYSGGTMGTGWAALMQDTYAKDLSKNIIGYALGGIAVNVKSIAQQNMGHTFAGFVIAAMNGLSHEYPSIAQVLQEYVIPSERDVFESTNKVCEIVYLPEFINAQWSTYFTNGEGILDVPAVVEVMDSLNMITLGLTPVAPLFFYQAQNDEILPASDVDTLFDTLCTRGVSIDYALDETGGHISEAIFGAGSAFTWLKARYNGQTQSGCNKNSHLSNALTPEGLSGFDSLIGAALWQIWIGIPSQFYKFLDDIIPQIHLPFTLHDLLPGIFPIPLPIPLPDLPFPIPDPLGIFS
jgi:hypothetical protein